MRRSIGRSRWAAALVIVMPLVPGAGCSNCAEVNCDGPAVVISLLGMTDVGSAEVCFNDDCAPSPVSTYNDGGADVAMTSRDLIASDVDPGERFEVSIRVFDTDGILIANLADERRRKDDGDCGCDRFGYRWNGDRFDRW